MLEDRDEHIERTGLKELAWFVGLWLLGVASVLAVASLIRLVL